MAQQVYRPSPIKRLRRSKAEVEALKAGLYEIAKAGRPSTSRNICYRAAVAGLIEKNERQFKATARFLVQMRRDGDLPYSWMADNTRWRHQPRAHSSLEDMLHEQHRLYRRAIWRDQPRYMEAWLEKDSMVGTVYPETARWGVPLMPCRGYPSLTFLFEAAEEIREQGKPTVILYAGDFDPTGVHISKKVEEELRGFCPRIEMEFVRLAINENQIAIYNLPTRPTKKSDSRSRSFTGDSVELEAMDANELRRLFRAAIEENVDHGRLELTKLVESCERDTLQTIIDNLEGAA